VLATLPVLAGCSSGPSLSVRNVTVNRTRTFAGEPVGVNATVVNDGRAGGERRVALVVNGTERGARTVSVAGGEEQTVTLVARLDPGEYDLRVDGRSAGRVRVDPALVVRSATLAESVVGVGDAATVRLTVDNRASVARTREFPASAGESVASRRVSVPAGGRRRVELRVAPGRGEHAVTAGGESVGRLRVEDAWRQAGYAATRTGSPPTGGVVTGPTAGGEAVWRRRLPEASFSSPVAVGDRVYVGFGNTRSRSDDDGGGVAALSLADGGVEWTARGPGDVVAAPAVADGAVLTGATTGPRLDPDSRGRLRAVETDDGSERWVRDLDDPVVGPPAVADGRVYATTTEGLVLAVEAATGETVWETAAIAPVFGGPAVGDLVYVGGLEGHLEAFAPADGSRQWRYRTGGDRRIGPTPAVADGQVVVASHRRLQPAVHAVVDGEQRWRVDTGEAMLGSPAVADGRVFVPAGLGVVATDGDGIAWRDRTSEFGTVTASAPAVVDDTVYVGSSGVDGGRLLAYATDGSVRWTAPADAGTASPAVLDGRVVTGVGFASVAAFAAPDPADGGD
jgi:outer membrane protein assembly factor BamB